MAISGHKSRKEVYEYLQNLAIAVLSTVSRENKADAAPIYFITDKDLNFFFLTQSDTTKSRNLQTNNNAALTIIDPTSPKTIQATGKVTEVDDPDIYRKIIVEISETNAKSKNFYWPPPLSKLDSSGDLMLYKFQPDWLRLADFTESTKENIFYHVIPSKT